MSYSIIDGTESTVAPGERYVTATSADANKADLQFALDVSTGDVRVRLNLLTASMIADVPVPVMRRMARWLLDHTEKGTGEDPSEETDGRPAPDPSKALIPIIARERLVAMQLQLERLTTDQYRITGIDSREFYRQSQATQDDLNCALTHVDQMLGIVRSQIANPNKDKETRKTRGGGR